jgi:hypothetical protein
MLEIMGKKKVSIPFQNGLLEGFLPSLNLDIPEMDRFLERVARAVLYDAYGMGFFAGRVRWIPIEATPHNLLPHLNRLLKEQSAKREILDVFEYRTSPPFSAGTYIIEATFYRTRKFILQVQTIET